MATKSKKACTKTASWWKAKASPIWAEQRWRMPLFRNRYTASPAKKTPTALCPSSVFSWATRRIGPSMCVRSWHACKPTPTRIPCRSSAPTGRSPTWRSSRRPSAAKRATPWCAPKSVRFGNAALEVQNDIGIGRSAVFPRAEHVRLDPIDFDPRGKMRIDPVIRATANLQFKSVFAKARQLRKDMHSAGEGVQPRLPLGSAPGNFGTAAIANIFYAFALKDRSRKRGVDVSFHAEPFVREIGERGVGANAGSVIERRAKAHQRKAQRQLKAVIIAAAI